MRMRRSLLPACLVSRRSKLFMNVYRYRIIPAAALETYLQNGRIATFDEELLNGELIINAPDEETADKMRMTYTDIRMWERVASDLNF